MGAGLDQFLSWFIPTMVIIGILGIFYSKMPGAFNAIGRMFRKAFEWIQGQEITKTEQYTTTFKYD